MSSSEDLKNEVIAKYKAGASKKGLSKDFDIPRSTIRYWLRGIERDDDDFAGAVKQAVKAVKEAEEPLSIRQERIYKDKIQKLTTQLKEAVRYDISAESIRNEVFKLADVTANPPDWIIADETNVKTDREMPIAIWSDWHVGEYVDPKQVNGVNEFDLEIAKKRVRRLVESTIHICYDHRKNPSYKGIIINLAGDFISGDIHQELIETNEFSSLPAMMHCFDLMVWALTAMADRFERVFCPCTFGNHGRNTHKPQHKNAAYQNFDWLMYQLLDRHFKNDPRITFYIPTQVDAQYEAYGIRFMLTHGDNLGTSGGDGIIGALGPIMRGDSKTRNANAAMNADYDVILMGHWHQYLEMPGAIGFVNGCLIGYNEYAKNRRFRYQRPTQTLFFVHTKHGITFRTPVYCDDVAVEHRATVAVIE